MRAALILSVPALSLLLPGVAVEVASAGGTGELTRVAAGVSKFLLFYSGVFALIALSGAVAAGLLATDRLVMTPERRILSHAAHRTMSLIGVSALANHIMLEIIANRAGIADSIVPFLATRSTFFMGLGTVSSDLFVVIIMTGVLRRRFATGSRPQLWRILHVTAYAAWPMAVLHGLVAGRSAKPYVDWSYGACLAAAALALTIRVVVRHRGRSGAPAGPLAPAAAPSWPPMAMPVPTAPALPAARPDIATTRAVTATRWPRPRPALQSGPLRALPSAERPPPGPWPPQPHPVAARWTEPPLEAADAGYPPDEDDWVDPQDGSFADQDDYAADQDDWAADEDDWVDPQDGSFADQNHWADQHRPAPGPYGGRPAGPGAWAPRPDGWERR